MFVELGKSDWQSEIIPELHECAALKAPEVQLEMNGLWLFPNQSLKGN